MEVGEEDEAGGDGRRGFWNEGGGRRRGGTEEREEGGAVTFLITDQHVDVPQRQQRDKQRYKRSHLNLYIDDALALSISYGGNGAGKSHRGSDNIDDQRRIVGMPPRLFGFPGQR